MMNGRLGTGSGVREAEAEESEGLHGRSHCSHAYV